MTDDRSAPDDKGDLVAPGVVRLIASNPSPLTGRGTNTYLVGDRDITVIDPGPDMPGRTETILAALPNGAQVRQIVVTHSHLDHSPAARPLAAATGAPVLAFGDAMAGRNLAIARLGELGGGEGLDHAFRPDILVADGTTLGTDRFRLTALHTPGHLGNHLCLAMGDIIFSGDHVMGWATSIVSPPDGDMAAYMSGLERLAAMAPRRLLPGHGDPVEDAQRRITELAAHRRSRETAILDTLTDGPATPTEIAERVYTGLAPALLFAAERNVLAHLIDLEDRSIVSAAQGIGPYAVFQRM